MVLVLESMWSGSNLLTRSSFEGRQIAEFIAVLLQLAVYISFVKHQVEPIAA